MQHFRAHSLTNRKWGHPSKRKLTATPDVKKNCRVKGSFQGPTLWMLYSNTHLLTVSNLNETSEKSILHFTLQKTEISPLWCHGHTTGRCCFCCLPNMWEILGKLVSAGGCKPRAKCATFQTPKQSWWEKWSRLIPVSGSIWDLWRNQCFFLPLKTFAFIALMFFDT